MRNARPDAGNSARARSPMQVAMFAPSLIPHLVAILVILLFLVILPVIPSVLPKCPNLAPLATCTQLTLQDLAWMRFVLIQVLKDPMRTPVETAGLLKSIKTFGHQEAKAQTASPIAPLASEGRASAP